MATYRPPDFATLGLSDAPDCRFEAAPADAMLPHGFLCTTNFPTYVRAGGAWRMPEDPRMDSHIVWDKANDRLMVREFRNISKGDLVAIAAAEDGSEGVYVWDKGFQAPSDGTHHEEAFSFMSSDVSREKPVDYDGLLAAFKKNRGDNGHIIWVIGPALVHSRGRAAMDWLIRNGYCHALLTGNAVPVHDIEMALFGSTLGMYSDGSPAAGGHNLHMKAINAVKHAGGIQAICHNGQVESGIMKACVDTGTPYVICGSIRDDGPLPETITDAGESQSAMREQTVKATMVVMVATALHAIAVGNMLATFCTRPDGSLDELATIVVDQTEFLVSKLKDRGTHQAFGVVTNAQDFMRVLQLELAE